MRHTSNNFLVWGSRPLAPSRSMTALSAAASAFALEAPLSFAAALAFAGSLIGFCLPLANTIAGSVSLVDCAIWGLIALVVQILIYYAARVPMPKMSERIENGEMASGVWLGSASLAGGLLNAACMTY